jgi:serine/threonine protein kinase/tetratricopeptide (TPR) repeat protein
MISALRICPKCGSEIPADAPEGGCPGCLLESGLGAFVNDEENPAAVTEGQHATGTERVAVLAGEFGDYELLEEIGHGGQGIVYLARQKSLNRTVALKILKLGPWASRAAPKRFRREAAAAASLDHPRIVPIYEVGERDGSCYFSMQFVEGGQLDEVLQREPIPIRRAVELIAKVARTVHYAHEHGILHRDIKPGNILLDSDGEPHLTDFGLARLVEAESTVTGTQAVMGTPSYMAPEQAAGESTKLSMATDVYGLGAVLYQLLTSHPPFAGDTIYETIKLLLATEPRQPHLLNSKIDRDLSTICLTCLEKDPQRRYSSALALAEDLEHWLKHEPIHAKRTGFVSHACKWVRRNPPTAALIASLIALAAIMGWSSWKRELISGPPAKSIAVLPFSNLSQEKANAFLADGVQDAILTDLSHIADLKVVGRTSVMQYKSDAARDLRKIGNELGVANVLEAAVQHAGNRLRVNAQLVDTRTGTVTWAQQYDRDSNDLFAVQSEIAQEVARQLQTQISDAERVAIERKPTGDLAAYDLYIRSKILIESALFSTPLEEGLFEAVRLLNQAIQRDPAFDGAYFQIARAHDLIYFSGVDHTPARLAMADAAIQSLGRLRPNSGETHLALGEYLYRCYHDYDHARNELNLAKENLPNDPLLFELLGFMDRRQGRWTESTRNLQLAVEFDPQNAAILQQIATSYVYLRRYADAERALDRAIALVPKDSNMRGFRAEIELLSHADMRPLRSVIRAIVAEDSREATNLAQLWLEVSLCERDVNGAQRALAAMPIAGCYDDSVPFPHAWCEGIVAQMAGDKAAAGAAFRNARNQAAKLVAEQRDYAQALCVLGMADAALGNKEDAIREGRRAVKLLPVTKDSVTGAQLVQYLALIYAWTGEKDLAIQQVAIAAHMPGYLSYGELYLHPRWDALRGDPRFEQIVASLGPKRK